MIAHFEIHSLQGICHRIVHGGEKYVKATVITPAVEKDLAKLSELAPLHNPPALEGIAAAQALFPQVMQVGVFDTAFHAHLPPKAAFYPIPWELSQKYRIKRYGFHGIAHAFSWKKYVELSGNPKSKVITVHLGSGCSLAAIEAAVSVDTTMGFTPLDGVMMATRSGELDPAIVAFLCEKEKKSPDEVIRLLNHQSGLLGIAGSSSMQDLLKKTDSQAKLAIEMFLFHIQKKIGAFIAVLEGVDALIFSGGIGENNPELRQKLVKTFGWYGLSISDEKNRSCKGLSPGSIESINDTNSLYVVGSDENALIAEECRKLPPKICS